MNKQDICMQLKHPSTENAIVHEQLRRRLLYVKKLKLPQTVVICICYHSMLNVAGCTDKITGKSFTTTQTVSTVTCDAVGHHHRPGTEAPQQENQTLLHVLNKHLHNLSIAIFPISTVNQWSHLMHTVSSPIIFVWSRDGHSEHATLESIQICRHQSLRTAHHPTQVWRMMFFTWQTPSLE